MLPVTLLFIVYVDTLYGSKTTFRIRLWSMLFVVVVILMFAPFAGKIGLIFIAMGLGICTWISNGAVATLASVVQNNANTYQQFGFMLPGVYCLIMVIALRLSADELSIKQLMEFYWTTAGFVLVGIFCWVRTTTTYCLFTSLTE